MLATAAFAAYGCGSGTGELPAPTVAGDRAAFELSARDTAVAASNAFRADFISSGKDIHTLSDAFIRTQALGDGTLASALNRSSIVLVGTVTAQRAETDGYVATTLRVDDGIDAPGGTREIVVVQNGGPSQTSNGPALVQDDMSPILVPGNTYVLFGRPAGVTTDGKYRTPFAIGGPGTIYVVVNGVLHAVGEPDDLPAELAGATLADARAAVLAERGAHPGP